MRHHPEVEEKEVEDEEVELMDECPYAISFLTEFTGMALNMMVGCLGTVYRYGIGPVIESFCFGFGRLAVYMTFNHISPVHVNPAKSLGFVVLGRMEPIRFAVYVIAQYTGSIAGVAITAAVLPSNIETCCVNSLFDVTPMQAFVMECITTMLLILAVASATDPLNENGRESMSLRIGFIVLGLILTIEPFTLAGKNPARSFAPALLYNSWKDHWVFEAAPFAGGVLGGAIYRFIFNRQEKYSLYKFVSHKTATFAF